jgi:hypothetical protein
MSFHGPFGVGAVCQWSVTGAEVVDVGVYVAVKTAFCPSITVCVSGSTATCPAAAPVTADGAAAEDGAAVVADGGAAVDGAAVDVGAVDGSAGTVVTG